MGYILKIPKPLITPSPSSPMPSPPHKPPPPMLYYSIVVVATAAIVLGIYNLIILRLCTIQYHRRRYPETVNNTMSPPLVRSLSRGGSTVCLISSFKYKKGAEGSHNNGQVDYEMECSVCLSVLEEGEEVKRLPMCHHCFHASCIDMWLCSHIHCPLCRAPVVEPPPPPPSPGTSSV